jgi:hypothetical protein
MASPVQQDLLRILNEQRSVFVAEQLMRKANETKIKVEDTSALLVRRAAGAISLLQEDMYVSICHTSASVMTIATPDLV